MSQIDTGLGWSVKDSYYKETTGVIASIDSVGGSMFPGQPIPNTERNTMTRDLVKNNGLLVASGFSPIVDVYVMSEDTSNAIVAAKAVSSGYYWNFLIAATSSPITIGIVWVRRSDGSIIDYKAQVNGTPSIGPNGLYLWDWDTGRAYDGPIMPVYSNLNSFANDIQVNHFTFTKKNAGPSACCVFRWKTPNGTRLESPILISSNSSYVDMETDVTGANLAKLNILYEGMKFYMGFYDRPYTGELETQFPDIDRSYQDAPTFTLEDIFRYIAKDVYGNIIVLNPPDPYQEGEGSEPGGGDGEEDTEDDVDFTDPPSTSIGATGFLTIFCPSLYELQQLAQFMWSSFDLDNWRKIIANPMDAILGLHIIPVPATITGTKSLKVAGIDTTYSMSYTTVRYIRRSMGSCDIPKKWGAYLDYNPYTKLSIFLPYIGFRDLDADDVMGKTISLQYIIDILTGACVAELKCEDTVLYSWTGNCANEVPISSSDWRGAIASAVGIAGTIAATAVATGGATAPMAVNMVASVGANSMNLKPTINRSGSISGSPGFIAAQRPYIIRTYPNLVIPDDQNKFIGYPSFVTVSLGSLTGYNEIDSIHLENIPATGQELEELESILKGGVIF